MSDAKRIDIIIPAYNAHNTILRTLSSIAIQEIIDDLDVTIVNDCSDKDYSEFVDMFSSSFSIREIKMEKNGGPGVARQYGIDHTSNPLLTFIDADDTFSGAFALKELRRQLLADPKSHTCVGAFVEEHPDSKYLNHAQDFVWMFGKLYTRAFLDKYKIRFNETRANEDNGFNTLIKLCSNANEQIKFIPDVVYYWHMREDSITRINNCEYSYNQSFVGYTDNMIYAILEAKKRNPFNSAINLFVVEVLCNLYEYLIECYARDPRFKEQNLNACKKYYREVYKDVEKDVNDQILAANYNNVMRNAYAGNKLNMIIPEFGIKEFIKLISEE